MFEYHVEIGEAWAGPLSAQTLNELGAERWELVTVLSMGNNEWHYIFKRLPSSLTRPYLVAMIKSRDGDVILTDVSLAHPQVKMLGVPDKVGIYRRTNKADGKECVVIVKEGELKTEG